MNDPNIQCEACGASADDWLTEADLEGTDSWECSECGHENSVAEGDHEFMGSY